LDIISKFTQLQIIPQESGTKKFYSLKMNER
jgi:hypothetical protein